MTPATATLLEMLGDWAWIGGVVFLRVGGAMALLPAFGTQTVPVRVRLALTLAFTAIVAPAVAPQIGGLTPALPSFSPGTSTGAPAGLALRLLGTETICGLLLGASVRLFIWMLQIAGTIAAQATSLSQVLGPSGIDPQPAIAQLLVMAALALAAMAGLHVRVAEALILSYDTLPPGLMPAAGDVGEWGRTRVAETFALAFTFSGPFLIAALIYNVALGVINRAMPQLMVAFVGAPAITAGGLALLIVVLPLVLPIWLNALNGTLAAPFAVGR